MLHNNILYNKYNIVQSQQGCNHDGTQTIVYLYIDIFQGIVFFTVEYTHILALLTTAESFLVFLATQ